MIIQVLECKATGRAMAAFQLHAVHLKHIQLYETMYFRPFTNPSHPRESVNLWGLFTNYLILWTLRDCRRLLGLIFSTVLPMLIDVCSYVLGQQNKRQSNCYWHTDSPEQPAYVSIPRLFVVAAWPNEVIRTRTS